jgi:hypothetical protein
MGVMNKYLDSPMQAAFCAQHEGADGGFEGGLRGRINCQSRAFEKCFIGPDTMLLINNPWRTRIS